MITPTQIPDLTQDLGFKKSAFDNALQTWNKIRETPIEEMEAELKKEIQEIYLSALQRGFQYGVKKGSEYMATMMKGEWYDWDK